MAIINGTNFGEALNGTNVGDTINGLGGADTLFGDLGLDILNGGNGDDTFDVTDQAQIFAGETYNGGLGFDTLNLSVDLNIATTIVNADVEALSGGANITMTAAQLGNFSNISVASVTISNAGVADLTDATVFGTINLSALGNTLNLTGVQQNMTVNGGAAIDVITGGDEAFFGDTLNGGGGNDTINGAGGGDAIEGGAGRDTVNGGTGDDTFQIADQAHIVAAESYTGGDGFDTLWLNVGGSMNISALAIAADVERLQGPSADIAMTAAQLNNFSVVENGFSSITLTTGGAADLSGATVESTTFVLSNLGNTLNLAGVENNFFGFNVTGGNGADTITGGDDIDGDAIVGGLGNDVIAGGAGNDNINGQGGRDTISGGDGDDIIVVGDQAEIAVGETYNGGDGFDILAIQAGGPVNLSSTTINADIESLQSGVVVSMKAAQLDAFIEVSANEVILTDAGIADLSNASEVNVSTFRASIFGNTINLGGRDDQDYILIGSNGADTLIGGDRLGGDTLRGGAGADVMSGGLGNDVFEVAAQAQIGAGETYNGGAGFDEVRVTENVVINFSAATFDASLEGVESNSAVFLTASQLDGLSAIQAFGVTLTNGGTVNLAGAQALNSTFTLANVSTTFSLAGAASTTGFVTITGGSGHDVITGADEQFGFDVITGGLGNDTINGGKGGDNLTGGQGVDSVNGDDGNDIMYINAQVEIVAGDSMSGGAGFDIVQIATPSTVNVSAMTFAADIEILSSGGVVLMAAAQLDSLRDVSATAVTLTTSGVANLTSTTVTSFSANTFNLNAAGNTLNAAKLGNQGLTVNGSSGADTITGGDFFGGDTLNGGGGNDVINGAGGGDTIHGGAGIDQISGGAGNDTMRILAQAEFAAGETYSGGTGFDVLRLETASTLNLSTLNIAADVERLQSTGAVQLTASQLDAFSSVSIGTTTTLTTGGSVLFSNESFSTGNIFLNAAGNGLNLNNLNTQGYTVIGNIGADVVQGGARDDTFTGGGGNDTLQGENGNDILTGGAGTDLVIGGNGDDQLIIATQADLAAGEQFFGGLGFDEARINTTGLVNISNVTFGNDVEGVFSNGAVLMNLTQANTFVSFKTAGAITFTAAGTANMTGDVVETSTFNLSNLGPNHLLLIGSRTNHTVNAGPNDDIVNSGDGDDIILGGGGFDILNGSAGDDTLTGGAGFDNLDGGAENDTFVYNVQSEIVASESVVGGDGIDRVLIQSADAIDISALGIGSSVETIEAAVNVSMLAVHADSFSNFSVSGEITLTTAGTVNLAGATVGTSVFNLSNAGNNTFSLAGAAAVINHDIRGGSFADNITGGAFADTINGGGSADTLTGGLEGDVFRFSELTAGNDTITDFSGITAFGGGAGQGDKLGFNQGGGAVGVTYLGAGAFTNTGFAEARFGGVNQLQVDLNGNGAADFTVTINGFSLASKLVQGDFL